jgi:hypothetical protein
MFVIPKKSSDPQNSILLSIKNNLKSVSSMQVPILAPVSLISPKKTISDPVSFCPNINSNTNNPYESINMDHFITKMTLKGQLLSIDVTNLKNSFNNDNSGSLNGNKGPGNFGLLQDFNNRKNISLFDYIHNNDISHLNKHISDGLFIIKLFF